MGCGAGGAWARGGSLAGKWVQVGRLEEATWLVSARFGPGWGPNDPDLAPTGAQNGDLIPTPQQQSKREGSKGQLCPFLPDLGPAGAQTAPFGPDRSPNGDL